MKTKITSALTMVVLTPSSTAILFAQKTKNDWTEVKKLLPRSELFVRTKDGKTIRGVLQKADDSQLL